MRSDLHDVTVIYQTATALAVCVREVEDSEDIWIPRAQCEIAPVPGSTLLPGAPLRRGSPATLTAPERVLIEKGLV